VLRRAFLQKLAGLGMVLAAAPVAHGSSLPFSGVFPRRLLIQTSQVAGFHYHEGDAVWSHLRVGDTLELVREPENRHDAQAVAVAVAWNGHKLGYVPRAENTAVAQMMDRGERLSARITALEESDDPWDRGEFAVEVE
jgi:hypothetical protein